MSDVQKRYVLVEVTTEVPADVMLAFDVTLAMKLKRALGHYYHNSPRTFRTADVTVWLEGQEEEWMEGP